MSTSTILMLLAFAILYKIVSDRKPADADTCRPERNARDKDSGRSWWDSGKFWGFTAGCHDLDDEFGGAGAQEKPGASQREMEEKVAAMEARLKVLERIVTDKGYNVAEEIDRL